MKNPLKRLWQDRRGVVSPKEIITVILAFFIAAVLMPVGLTAIGKSSNWTSYWDPTTITIFTIVFPLIAIIGVALYFLPKLGKGE